MDSNPTPAALPAERASAVVVQEAKDAKMKQVDWVGDMPPSPPFKDMKNVRQSTAERKAELSLALRDLLMRAPHPGRIESVNGVRQYKLEREIALKVAANTRSTVPQLEGAFNTMTKWRAAPAD